MTGTPWPIVGECYLHNDGSTCAQCDGSHGHAWVAWHDAPQVSAGTVVVGGQSGPGVPVRCRVCGARKCDVAECTGRRHHADAHTLLSGDLSPMGGYWTRLSP